MALDIEKLDIERLVISSIIKEQDFRSVVEKGITEVYFTSAARAIFEYIRDYYNQYRSVPTKEFYELKFDDYELYDTEVTEPIEMYLDELRNHATFYIIVQSLAKLSTETKKRPPSVEKMKQLVFELANEIANTYTPIRQVDIRENAEERIRLLKDRADPSKRELGIETPWPLMNSWLVSGGFTPGQLITLVGSMGSGKTFFMTAMAIHAWLQGKSVLFFTNEMTEVEIQDRIEAIMSSVPTGEIADGSLLKHLQHKESYLHYRDKITNQPVPFIIVEDAETTGPTIIQSKIQQFNPDIVFVDGAYLWADTEWKEAVKFTRALKKVAKDNRKPTVVSWQFNKQGKKKEEDKRTKFTGGLADIGYTFSLGQDSDVVLSCYPKGNEAVIKILKQRQGVKDRGIKIHFNHFKMDFSEIGEFTDTEKELTDEELDKAQKADEETSAADHY